MENTPFEDRSKFKYMLFQLGDDIYGTPLLSIREVIENKPPRAVPNSAFGFEGVINLRGEVIGIIDLRKFLKITPSQSLSILVFESELGILGAIVDRCLAVIEIPESEIESTASSASLAGGEYFLGVAKTQKGLISLISLAKLTELLGKQSGLSSGVTA